MMTSPTLRTMPRRRHAREIPSHFSGVVTMTCAPCITSDVSPVTSTTLIRGRFPGSTPRTSSAPSRRRQSLMRSRTSALSGATYTHTLRPPCSFRRRQIASSAAAVFPDPVGAPSSMLWSLWNAQWNICVWIGLKCVNFCAKSGANAGGRTFATARGRKSRSGVRACDAFGSIRWRSETVAIVVAET